MDDLTNENSRNCPLLFRTLDSGKWMEIRFSGLFPCIIDLRNFVRKFLTSFFETIKRTMNSNELDFKLNRRKYLQFFKILLTIMPLF